MSNEPADIYTQLKRSYLRGTGLRLNNEAVRVLYERAGEDAKKTASAVADAVADYLFANGSGQKARRLVLELEDSGRNGGGYSKEAVADAVCSERRGQAVSGSKFDGVCIKRPYSDGQRMNEKQNPPAVSNRGTDNKRACPRKGNRVLC